MSLKKKILKHAITQFILAFLIASIIRLLLLTNKIVRTHHPDAELFMQSEKNGLFVFWHGRLLMAPFFNLKSLRKAYVLNSRHGDGTLMVKMMGYFNLHTIRGSTGKGGHEAHRNMVEALKAGHNVSITPDGPRGPNRELGMGVVHVAKLAKMPIIPLAISASRAKWLNKWDKFMIPKPFGTLHFHAGAPYMVDANADKEQLENARIEAEQRLNALTDDADKAAGWDIQ